MRGRRRGFAIAPGKWAKHVNDDEWPHRAGAAPGRNLS